MFSYYDIQLARLRYQEYNDQFKNLRTPLPQDDQPSFAQRVLASVRQVLRGLNLKRTNGYASGAVAK